MLTWSPIASCNSTLRAPTSLLNHLVPPFDVHQNIRFNIYLYSRAANSSAHWIILCPPNFLIVLAASSTIYSDAWLNWVTGTFDGLFWIFLAPELSIIHPLVLSSIASTKTLGIHWSFSKHCVHPPVPSSIEPPEHSRSSKTVLQASNLIFSNVLIPTSDNQMCTWVSILYIYRSY